MTHHVATHAKTFPLKRAGDFLSRMARRYVRAHRKYHLLVVGLIFAVEIWALFNLHEHIHHITIAGVTWGWDTFIILLGEVDGE